MIIGKLKSIGFIVLLTKNGLEGLFHNLSRDCIKNKILSKIKLLYTIQLYLLMLLINTNVFFQKHK